MSIPRFTQEEDADQWQDDDTQDEHYQGADDNNQPEDDDEGQPEDEVNTTLYYELLEVAKDATTEQISKAFRKKALKEHPDKGGDVQKFSKLKQAYETLTNPEKRALYDQYGQEGVKNGGPPGGTGNLFDLLRGKKKGPTKLRPKLVQVPVTLQEIYHGSMKHIPVTRYRICVDCEGKGGKTVLKCEQCKGQGGQIKMVQLGPGMYTQNKVECTACEGRGQTIPEADKCKTCEGKKIIKQEKIIDMAIEQGVPDNHDYILTGESDEVPGVIAGDLYMRVKLLSHERYERRGADLLVKRSVTLLEALTGVTLRLEHLDGKEYVVATSLGDVLEDRGWKTLPKLGMPFYKQPMLHGNLYFEFMVQFPSSGYLNEQQIAQLWRLFNKPTILQAPAGKILQLQQFKQEYLNSKAGLQQQQQDEEQDNAGRVQCQTQ